MTFIHGSTSRAIEGLKKNGVFVWCGQNLTYPKRLAVFLGREDIQIIRPESLKTLQGFRGTEISDIVLDPGLRLSSKLWYWYQIAKSQVREDL